MTALLASDVTVTIDKSTMRKGPRGVRSHILTLAFGDGAKTYPANGVPLPSGQALGFPRGNVELLDIVDQGASLAMISWDKAHGTIRMVHPVGGTNPADGVEYLTNAAPAAQTLKCQVWGI